MPAETPSKETSALLPPPFEPPPRPMIHGMWLPAAAIVIALLASIVLGRLLGFAGGRELWQSAGTPPAPPAALQSTR